MVSLLCTLDFTEFLTKLLPSKNSDKILWILHHRPIFYVVRLYVMTKGNGRLPERVTTSTMCHDELKLYLNLVNFNIEYDSMRHKI